VRELKDGESGESAEETGVIMRESGDSLIQRYRDSLTKMHRKRLIPVTRHASERTTSSTKRLVIKSHKRHCINIPETSGTSFRFNDLNTHADKKHPSYHCTE